jgi:phosphoribosylamine--glycine ligase
MKVLVIGNGGREHALCWKLGQSPLLETLFCAPGNPGISKVARNIAIAPHQIRELVDFAKESQVDLTVVGPELPLTLGIVDTFSENGLRIFGPSQDAARLEGSKVYAKQFMDRHSIPTARFEVVRSAVEARSAVAAFGLPVVLKADGLAAGKGVLIPKTEEELEDALNILCQERRFGDAADRLVVEECLVGEEVSVMALSDGKEILAFPTSKDYKRIGEEDRGPNTGGMGAHSPSRVLDAAELGNILENVVQRTVDAMREEGSEFRGVLYAGIMLTDDGPKVLEFNVRLGDPEAQPLLMRIENDLLPILMAGAGGDFEGQQLEISKKASACVVLASQGYPESPVTGQVITGLDRAATQSGVQVFHAGTKEENGQIVTAGGRVLNVCAMGATLSQALSEVYSAADEVKWKGKTVRRDIGRRVVMHSSKSSETGPVF